MTNLSESDPTPQKVGLVLHRAAAYDFAVWLTTFGRERAFRENLIRLARIQPGETILDVGCGTGTLAIAAKRRVGEAGKVYGIDASPEMLARARRKATRAGVDVVFSQAPAQALPFPEAQFDAVLTTIMLHHLPRAARMQCAREIGRVLKPGGRVLAVDFAASPEQTGLLSHIHHRHGHVKLDEIVAILRQARLTMVESGAVGYRNLQFALATAGGPA